MNILGLSFAHHESAAAIVVNGVLVAGIAAERVTRQKRDGISCGRRRTEIDAAIDYCLTASGLERGDIDLVVWSHVDHVSQAELEAILRREQARPLPSVRCVAVPHHFAHACLAYYTSGYDSAAIMILDGSGGPVAEIVANCSGSESDALRANLIQIDDALTDPSVVRREVESYYLASGPDISVVRKVLGAAARATIGPQYSAATWTLFGSPLECGKTMGLSAYAHPPEHPLFLRRDASAGGSVLFRERRSDERSKWEREIEQWRRDYGADTIEQCPTACSFAAGIQAESVEAIVELGQWLQQKTGASRLCLAGGVALNCLANTQLAKRAGFDDVFVTCAPGDDGIAAGAALFGAASVGELIVGVRAPHRLGRSYNDQIAEREVELVASGLDVYQFLAHAIAEGAIVAWFAGRSEYGPRALGARSFLADPRIADMPTRLNDITKQRERFRPFAPVVLSKDVPQFFEDVLPSRYMSFALPIRPKWRSIVPAVIHVDGTARYQSLERDDAPELYALIEAFQERSGLPMLLNTSFNQAGEPLAETPTEAVECFLASRADYLFVQGRLYRPKLPVRDGSTGS